MLLLLGIVAVAVAALGAWQISSAAAPREAPEVGRVLVAQADMPFQILIPAYLPAAFDRARVDIKIDEAGPGGEPMAQLTYRTARGAGIFLRQWVPVHPDLETLANSRPIQTKWGKGSLLTQPNLVAAWVDIGPTRISVFSTNLDTISRDQIVQVAETLGPPSLSRQVFTFIADAAPVKEMPPPPPTEIQVNAQGVQEFTLVITPGGYSPLRFAVKKDIPVKMTFKQLGQVGCGNVLIFPADPQNPVALELKSETDKQVLEFTPRLAGSFQFNCGHIMYRGIMTVTE